VTGRRASSVPATAKVVKRAFDIVVSAALLLLTSPILAIAAVVVRVRSPGPVVFRQWRGGRGARPFEMLKLRTMHVNADEILSRSLAESEDRRQEWRRYRRLRRDPRVIPAIGTFLRASSIDELPQLWNVLRGDMSLVGPRPLELPVLAGLNDVGVERRASVRPGITGLWQVSGRSDIDLDTLMSMDAEYVDTWSLWSDVRILCRTPAAVLSRRGAY
jgi:lipopolysaccharide/colanic/teichoic acid biosynthesis glycosyltransferase